MITVDRLIEETIKKKNPSVIGLDPDLSQMPDCYKQEIYSENPLQAAAEAIEKFNRDIIDTVFNLVPAVKPQIAFYEQYGSYGIRAFENTILYAKKKGLVVIADAKRNDIGNTVNAYAQAYLGKIEALYGEKISAFDVDFLTVNPFMGSDSMKPFLNICKLYGKGIFILVKTSNPGSNEIQMIQTKNGISVSEDLAIFIAKQTKNFFGKYGYSPIGAVVGATYPEEAAILRKIMPKNYFLVPGYGIQGGSEKDIIACFHPNGLGAIVNSSRGILYSHMTDFERKSFSKQNYLKNVRKATQTMQEKIYHTLKESYPDMIY